METFFKYFVSVVNYVHLCGLMIMLDEKKVKILETVNRLFTMYGIKSLTMDDIAREMGISKKTLYQYCQDKNDLLLQVMRYEMKDHSCKIGDILNVTLNAIDENLAIFKQIISDFSNMHPGLLFELKRYHPEAYNIYEQFKKTFMTRCITSNLEKGIKEGFYRADLNIEVIVINYIIMISNLFENTESFGNNHNFQVLYEELFKYHINGIATNKGRKYLAEKNASMNFNQ